LNELKICPKHILLWSCHDLAVLASKPFFLKINLAF